MVIGMLKRQEENQLYSVISNLAKRVKWLRQAVSTACA